MKIGRLFGAEVRLHWSFPVLAVVICLRDLVTAGVSEMTFSLAALGIFFVAVLLHEVGHVLAGFRAGGWSPMILIWPLGGLAELQGIPSRPRPQILVAAAGPLVNLAVAAALLAPLLALDLPLLGGWGMSFPQRLLVASFHANLLLFALNLVPAFPLDGGSVLRWALAALSAEGDLARATLTAVKVGKVSAVLLGIVGVAFWDFGYAYFLLFVALFAYLACERERRLVEFNRAAEEDGPSFLDGEPEPDLSGPEPRPPGFFARWREKRLRLRREREIRQEVEVRKRVDRLLEKIADGGMGALSEKEKAFLQNASKRYQRNGTAR